ncbi:hypothetical protein [Nocardia tengchongensis]
MNTTPSRRLGGAVCAEIGTPTTVTMTDSRPRSRHRVKSWYPGPVPELEARPSPTRLSAGVEEGDPPCAR